MRSKIYGILKLLIGIIFLILGIYLLMEKLNQNPNIEHSIMGYAIACIFFEFYGIYLLYSGLTQVIKLKLKKVFLILGLILNLIIVLITLSLFIRGKTDTPVTQIIFGLGAILIAIDDTLRIKRQNRSA